MADLWDDVRVQRWLDQSEGLDRQMTPITDAIFAAARLVEGERVLDVGCGHGPTTRRAATEVGASGAITGVDVAEPMLRAAASVETPAGAAPIEWLHADVQEWDPVAAGKVDYDAVISRYGVMFFSDPVRAFANLLSATAAEGRMAIATWAERDRSEMFELPLSITLPILESHGLSPDVPPIDAAAFSLGTPDRLADVLGSAGWRDVATREHQVSLAVHGGVDVVTAARAGLDLGPTRVVMGDQPESLRSEVAEAIAEAYGDHVDQYGHVRLGATFMVTTARA